jgi:hypothetical protein
MDSDYLFGNGTPQPVFDTAKSQVPWDEVLVKVPKRFGTTFPPVRRADYSDSRNVGGAATPTARFLETLKKEGLIDQILYGRGRTYYDSTLVPNALVLSQYRNQFNLLRAAM